MCSYFASIGPWLFSHGYVDGDSGNGGKSFLLQLGHGFSAMDTQLITGKGNMLIALQLGHGFSAMDTPSIVDKIESMN